MNAYVSLPADDSVAIVGLTDKKPMTTISVGHNPVNLAINSRANLEYLYTANQNDGTVSFVNLRSGSVEQPVQAGAQPWGIDVTPYLKLTTNDQNPRQYIVVANTGDNTITYIDPTSRSTSIKQVAGFHPHGVVASPKALDTYILSDSGPNCQVLHINADGTTGQPTTITGSVKLWKGAITPDGKTLYITDQGTTNLYKVDISNGFNVLNPIPLSGMGYDIAITPDGKTAYVSIPAGTSTNQQGVIDVIDLTTGSKTSTKPVNQRVTEANRPQALAVNAATTELWVALQNRLGYYGLTASSGAMEDDLRIAPYTATPGQAPPISDIVLGAGIQ
ncbi:MAG TPA: YncE family protein [Stenomitos sp.]